MKFDLPPPIPAKRQSPPQDPQAAPMKTVAPEDQDFLPPPPHKALPVQNVPVSNDDQHSYPTSGPPIQKPPPLPQSSRLDGGPGTPSPSRREPARAKWSAGLIAVAFLGSLIAALFLYSLSRPPTQNASTQSAVSSDNLQNGNQPASLNQDSPAEETPVSSTNASIAQDSPSATPYTTPYSYPSPTASFASKSAGIDARLTKGVDDFLRDIKKPSIAASPQPDTTPSVPVSYRVVGVAAGDYLNVRQGPGSSYPVVGRLAPNTAGIHASETALNAETVWRQISVSEYSGWVSANHLSPEMDVQTGATTPAPQSSLSDTEQQVPDGNMVTNQSAAATPAEAPNEASFVANRYRIANINGDYLNLRQGPGSNYPVIAKIPAGFRGITLGTRRYVNGTTIWREISVHGYHGYVSESYLEADTQR